MAKNIFQGVASYFTGSHNNAARDIARNFPVAGSRRTSNMVMAALQALGLMGRTRGPRSGSFAAAPPKPDAPRPGKNTGY